MPELLTPDLCVIGAGPGGLDVAVAAALLGKSVVLVEKGKLGGGWLHTGSVPSMAFLAAAREARRLRAAAALAATGLEAKGFGVTAGPVAVDFGKLREHIERTRNAIAGNATKERFNGLGVRVIEGVARFKSRRSVTVGETIEIAAKRFVIATGSLPAEPAIAGLDQVPHLTEDTIFDLQAIPEHLIVIGAGAIGLELAQAFHALGSKVTVLDAAAPLASEDGECVRIVLDQLARDGIAVRGGVTITRIERVQGHVRVVLAGTGDSAQDSGEDSGGQLVDGSDLLVTGVRWANVEGLALENARIKHAPQGILVNRALQSSNRRVYAIGDVTGPPYSVQAARHHAGLVVRNALFRQSVAADGAVVPRVIRTEPELAQVGLTDAQAGGQSGGAGRICVLRWPYREVDRARADGTLRGHIKVVTDRNGTVLGATIVGAGAGELIALWSLAVSQGLNIKAIAGTVVPSAALAEIGKRAAITYLLLNVTTSWVRRIKAVLRRFR